MSQVSPNGAPTLRPGRVAARHTPNTRRAPPHPQLAKAPSRPLLSWLCLVLATIKLAAASGPYGASLAPTFESELMAAPPTSHCVLTIKQVNSSSSYPAAATGPADSYLSDYVSR